MYEIEIDIDNFILYKGFFFFVLGGFRDSGGMEEEEERGRITKVTLKQTKKGYTGSSRAVCSRHSCYSALTHLFY